MKTEFPWSILSIDFNFSPIIVGTLLLSYFLFSLTRKLLRNRDLQFEISRVLVWLIVIPCMGWTYCQSLSVCARALFVPQTVVIYSRAWAPVALSHKHWHAEMSFGEGPGCFLWQSRHFCILPQGANKTPHHIIIFCNVSEGQNSPESKLRYARHYHHFLKSHWLEDRSCNVFPKYDLDTRC